MFVLVALIVVPPAPTRASAGDTTSGDAYQQGFRAFELGDRAAALAIWKPLAERGDRRAQFGLGLIYESGVGDKEADQEEALGWYRRAARQGLPAAQNNLALMYAEGRVVPRDPVLALALWREAAEAGYGPAQFNLAVALENGMGVGRNEREAALWFEKAQQQGITRTTVGQGPGQAARVGRGAEQQPGPEGLPSEPPERAPAPAPMQQTERRVEPDRGANGRTAAREPRPVHAPAPAPAAHSSSAFYVQLAAVRSHEDATRLAQDLATRNADFLAELEPTVRSVDLESRGVWHRVLFGPIATRAAAREICSGIRARIGDCLVAVYPVDQ